MIKTSCLVLLLIPVFGVATISRVSAQAPGLRIEGAAGARDIPAVHAVTSLYPVGALESLGGAVRPGPAGLLVIIFGDSIRFRSGSPFFVAGGVVYQLAFDATDIGGVLHLPEQFFVQWMPTHFSARVEYRAGSLRLRSTAPQSGRVAAETVEVRTLPAETASSRTSAPRSAPPPLPPPNTARPDNARSLPGTRSDRNDRNDRNDRSQANPQATAAPAAASRSKRIVVIDPGHGGIDSGAVGPDSIAEKDVVLMISNRLAALLRTRGYEVHMTRTTDTLISLGDRPRMANKWKGDEPGALYISIHNNSLRGAPAARGFETYFLADASTADERRVADMENASIKYEKNTRPAGDGLDQVLNGLRNDFYLRTSNAFADLVQHDLAQFHPGPNRGVKRANFRVLIGALMPAVLVEVAFISNPSEGHLLGTSSFQDKLAYSISEAVDAFFRDNEPLWMKQ